MYLEWSGSWFEIGDEGEDMKVFEEVEKLLRCSI